MDNYSIEMSVRFVQRSTALPMLEIEGFTESTYMIYTLHELTVSKVSYED